MLPDKQKTHPALEHEPLDHFRNLNSEIPGLMLVSYKDGAYLNNNICNTNLQEPITIKLYTNIF